MSRTKHKALTLLGVGFLLGIAVWFFRLWMRAVVDGLAQIH